MLSIMVPNNSASIPDAGTALHIHIRTVQGLRGSESRFCFLSPAFGSLDLSNLLHLHPLGICLVMQYLFGGLSIQYSRLSVFTSFPRNPDIAATLEAFMTNRSLREGFHHWLASELSCGIDTVSRTKYNLRVADGRSNTVLCMVPRGM
jgi:hypothetical protein